MQHFSAYRRISVIAMMSALHGWKKFPWIPKGTVSFYGSVCTLPCDLSILAGTFLGGGEGGD